MYIAYYIYIYIIHIYVLSKTKVKLVGLEVPFKENTFDKKNDY